MLPRSNWNTSRTPYNNKNAVGSRDELKKNDTNHDVIFHVARRQARRIKAAVMIAAWAVWRAPTFGPIQHAQHFTRRIYFLDSVIKSPDNIVRAWSLAACRKQEQNMTPTMHEKPNVRDSVPQNTIPTRSGAPIALHV